MATGQNSFSYTSYGESVQGAGVNSVYAYTQASYRSDAVDGTRVKGINPTVIGAATCNAIVTVLPTGLNVHGKDYYTDATEAALAALRT